MRSAAVFTIWAIASGGVDTGWTFYTPYSSTYSNTYVIAAAAGVFIAGFSSILDRFELHRHHPQDARPRADVGKACRSLSGRTMQPA